MAYLIFWSFHSKGILINLSRLAGTLQQSLKAHSLCMPLVFIDAGKVKLQLTSVTLFC